MSLVRESLAFFPLNVVVFPGEKVELYVFEPRYCELVHECEENEHGFGIIPVLKDELLLYGTEVELVKVNRSKTNGTSRIEVLGKRIFDVTSFTEKLPRHLYGGGEVVFRKEELPDFLGNHDALSKQVASFSKEDRSASPDLSLEYHLQKQVNTLFHKIRELLKKRGGFVFSKHPEAEKKSPTTFLGSSYSLAPHIMGLDLKRKAVLLAMEEEEERLQFIYEHMKDLLAVLKNSLND